MAQRTVVFAYHDVGVRCLRVLLDAGVEVALVVTHRDDPKENVWFGSVAELARTQGLPLLEDPLPQEIERQAGQIRPDFIFSFYYRRMLPPSILALAKRGAFNMHGSLLPKYRGRAPVNWAVLKGETETGATLHEMVEKPDAGRIVDQQAVPIGPDETAADVFRKVTDAAETVLRRCIKDLLSGKAVLKPQELSKGSYFGGRKPEDGRIDWTRSATEIHNLVRAVAPPYPGAFSGRMRILRTAFTDKTNLGKKPGPYQEGGEWFAVCGDGKVLRLLDVQTQWKKILILGVNGFIGHHLSKRILATTDWQVYGMDMQNDRIADVMDDARFHFFEGDITINKEWIEYHIRKCDTVLPLVAIATPASYVKEPLRVFELDFEANLPIVRACVRHGKRLVFPSTSEVYGMSPDRQFDPETSPLVYGPISRQRWIYACSKQLMDRVIWAYGQKEGLDFTLFRPFNWIGSGLDSINTAKEGSSRVVTQFFGHIVRGEKIQLVDGGRQKRAFTYIDDGIDALMAIIANRDGIASRKIFNIGNPRNNFSVRELAEMMVKLALEYPEYRTAAKKVRITKTSSEKYYGKGYQDMQNRVPAITNTQKDLRWRPRVNMRDALRRIFDAYRTHVAEARHLTR